MRKYALYLGSLLLFASLLSCFGTPVKVEDNIRASIIAKIVDENGNPIPDIPVYSGSSSDILGGVDISDENGEVDFNSLESTSSEFGIVVNISTTGVGFPSNQDYTFVSFRNRENDRQRYFYDLGTLVLRKKANLIVNVSGNYPGSGTLFGTIRYKEYECNYVVNDFEIDDELTYCGEIQRNTGVRVDEMFPASSSEIETVLGTTAIFEYSINDGPLQTVEIPINQNLVTYELEI